eukprot:TRINITY_DN15166_c0_g1_i1.p1 TRINITY_DN15166_c0_g1~~TRINITY_DN15166_c0_g1_i1.p1  ORF type:complete len:294 (-),score=54.34 TRINITY_DN15166_c0_g1_i1:195-1001(-)
MSSKHAQKRAAKKEMKEQARAEEEKAAFAHTTGQTTGSIGELQELATSLILGSCAMQYVPKLQGLLMPVGAQEGQQPEEKSSETDASEKMPAPNDADDVSMFATLGSRLAWHNALGLGQPETGAESIEKWLAFKSLEVDMGPKKAKKGNPSMDRVLANFCSHLPQYLHLLLALAMLHALLRSWFSCLPWLCFYQTASLLIPLETVDKLPQVPLSQVPIKYRTAASLAVHVLLLIFLVYEVMWKMNFLVKFLVISLLTFHAHSVKPAKI